jgi:hypothetical protein
VENKHEYCICEYHHEDGKDDVVHNYTLSKEALHDIDGMLSQHKVLVMVFNKGVFVSMKFDDSSTKRWAQLSSAEKDLVFFIQKNFNMIL